MTPKQEPLVFCGKCDRYKFQSDFGRSELHNHTGPVLCKKCRNKKNKQRKKNKKARDINTAQRNG